MTQAFPSLAAEESTGYVAQRRQCPSAIGLDPRMIQSTGLIGLRLASGVRIVKAATRTAMHGTDG